MSDNTVKPRKERIIDELKDTIRELGGLDRDHINGQATFLELGFDSLFLGLMTTAFEKKFKIKFSFRQLLEEVTSVDALARHIDSRLPPESLPPSTPDEKIVTASPKPSCDLLEVPHSKMSRLDSWQFAEAERAGFSLENIFSQQLEVMAKQLEVLKYCDMSVVPQVTNLPAPKGEEDEPGQGLGPEPEQLATKLSLPSLNHQVTTEVGRTGPWKPIDTSIDESLEPRQRKYLHDLIARYTRRTVKSKELTEAHRPHLADPRVVAGFRREWKEMVYPIVSARSSGAKLWDIDGNEYVDLIMGFGPALFGHSPGFLVRALEEQLKSGIEIGPQSPLAGNVAGMVCDFTGMERATFCNTGSEAVLAALRVARTVTGRSKIALFAGSYHGIFDEVLVRPIADRDGFRAMPVAPGIPPHMLQDVLVLDYGNPESLNVVERHADELAAVLVEPVQSRNPDLQPRELLKALREVTNKSGIALIFDEIITGFRLGPGGAQAWFGIQADLATYGKAIAGGMPIGVLAGKASFMDALDGGAWH